MYYEVALVGAGSRRVYRWWKMDMKIFKACRLNSDPSNPFLFKAGLFITLSSIWLCDSQMSWFNGPVTLCFIDFSSFGLSSWTSTVNMLFNWFKWVLMLAVGDNPFKWKEFFTELGIS
ncbi:hypothetical protein Tco_0112141 [Tanacetum coccineum]